MIKAAVYGAGGRMGRENVAAVHDAGDAELAGAIDLKGSPAVGQDAGTVAGVGPVGVTITDNIEQGLKNADAVIDFSSTDGTLQLLQVAAKTGTACVIGTTGFDSGQQQKIREFSCTIPVLLSPNMSRGVNTLFYLVKRAAELLGEEYDAEIVEIHHRMKKDAPSGTALQFGRVIAEARGASLDEQGVFGRHGQGLRKKGEIGIMALRASDVIGEHTITLAGPGERIELIHRNSSRKTYANGALQGARFLAGKKSGLFSMGDVLGL